MIPDPISRRRFLKTSALAAGAAAAGGLPAARARAQGPAGPRRIAPGPFRPTWESLAAGYRCPEWFRDAKFGIWAHWSAQCVPEQGDWYARRMYLQGEADYEHHLRHYGHPSESGFMEIDHLWKAERWKPEELIARYRRAGAKYFFALANHHDNFDNYRSRHHAWNSVNVGPRRDLIGEWGRAARAAGLKFGVSNHSAHAWHWFQVAYGYDPVGPKAGVRYDAYRLSAADGKGKWWEGLDPQELYCGRNLVMPDGLASIEAANAWHEKNDRVWNEDPPAQNPGFVESWFLRCQDLIDSYRPDVVYFDNTGLPLGQAGLDIAAHYYNSSLRWHGSLEVVVNGKKLPEAHRGALVEDIERGIATEIRPAPWQTDTCIGGWHYDRRLFTEHRYKTVAQVVPNLIDIVSKNGNLMLSIPVRGDGTIDEDETAFLDGLTAWMDVNGEGIFGSRPWTRYGEGPATLQPAEAGRFGGASDVRRHPYTAADIRFTRKGGALYAFLLGWPEDGEAVVASLPEGGPAGRAARVELLGAGVLRFSQDASGLRARLPEARPAGPAHTLKISGLNLA
ncbi:MAG TPA: alpha-L-fucosidase [Opitutaceae bacterium]|nr:alpha-L-fucosidase [Opitutaceae bacterium]